MKPQSAKAKGRNGQQEIRDLLLSLFPELEPDDIRSTSMGASGEDLLLSPKAREAIPYAIEVKRRKNISHCRWMDQAKGHGPYTPACFFREDHGQWFVTLRIKDFLDVVRGLQIIKKGAK